jgi:hypothetical protein
VKQYTNCKPGVDFCHEFSVAPLILSDRRFDLVGAASVAKAGFRKCAQPFLGHCQQSARLCVYKAAQFSEAIWTYVDRTQYALGRLPAAQQSLEPALKNSQEDHLAQLVWR